MSETVWTADFQGAFEHCRYLLGDELLAFLVNAPTVRADDPVTTRTARAVMARLDSLEREDPRLPVALVRKFVGDGLPFAWSMRQKNGGDVPTPLGSDELELALTRIARDIYPALLGPSVEMIVAGTGLTSPVADATVDLDHLVGLHPLHEQATALLDATGLPDSELIVSAAYAVARLSEVATASALVAAAVRRLRSVERPDALRLMTLVVEILGEVRLLADGNPVSMPASVGFTALPLKPGCHLELPQGVLRTPTPSERRFVPFMLQADAVLDTTVSCQAYQPEDDASPPQAEGQTALNQGAREVILASALASDNDVPHTPVLQSPGSPRSL
jgi:hypothetical protein